MDGRRLSTLPGELAGAMDGLRGPQARRAAVASARLAVDRTGLLDPRAVLALHQHDGAAARRRRSPLFWLFPRNSTSAPGTSRSWLTPVWWTRPRTQQHSDKSERPLRSCTPWGPTWRPTRQRPSTRPTMRYRIRQLSPQLSAAPAATPERRRAPIAALCRQSRCSAGCKRPECCSPSQQARPGGIPARGRQTTHLSSGLPRLARVLTPARKASRQGNAAGRRGGSRPREQPGRAERPCGRSAWLLLPHAPARRRLEAQVFPRA